MRPVVIAFVVTVLVILVAAIIFIKARQTKVVPKATDTRPTSRITLPAAPLPAPLPRSIAA